MLTHETLVDWRRACDGESVFHETRILALIKAISAARSIHTGHHWCADDEGRSDFFMVDGATGTPWPCATLAALERA